MTTQCKHYLRGVFFVIEEGVKVYFVASCNFYGFHAFLHRGQNLIGVVCRRIASQLPIDMHYEPIATVVHMSTALNLSVVSVRLLTDSLRTMYPLSVMVIGLLWNENFFLPFGISKLESGIPPSHSFTDTIPTDESIIPGGFPGI